MSCARLEDEEMGIDEFHRSDDSSARRALNFSGNEVLVATVSMSMEQSDEMRYVAAVVGDDLGSNDDAAGTMLAVSRKKTRRVTTTTAAYSTADEPLDIGIKVVFGEESFVGITKPKLRSGNARGNKRRILNKKNNPDVDPPKKKSPNKTQKSVKGKSQPALANKPKYNNNKGFNNSFCKCDVGNRLKSAKMSDFISSQDSKLLKEASNNMACACKKPVRPLKTKEIKKAKPKLKRQQPKGRNKKTLPECDKVEKMDNLIASAKFPKSNLKCTMHEAPPLIYYNDTNSSALKLCKNYAQQKCIMGYSCDYMHAEFPCKYYYLGLKCNDISDDNNTCKFLHDGPLTKDLLNSLKRHITEGSVDVVGKHFIDIVRSKKTVQEIECMLHEFQRKLIKEQNQKITEITNKSQQMVESNLLLETMRRKFHFLTEEQIESLKNLNVTQTEQAMHLTLWQLKSVGITKATQLAAFMNMVENNEQTPDMGKCNLVPQTLNSPVTAELSLTNEPEIDPILEEETVVQDAAIAIEASASNKVEKDITETINSVKTLQQLSGNVVENNLRIATRKLSQRIQKIKSSNVQRVDKKKELLDILKQLKFLEQQEKTVKNNKIFRHDDNDKELSYPVNITANAIETPQNITQTSKAVVEENQFDKQNEVVNVIENEKLCDSREKMLESFSTLDNINQDQDENESIVVDIISEDKTIDTHSEDVYEHIIAIKTPLCEHDAVDIVTAPNTPVKINSIQLLPSPKIQIVADDRNNDKAKVTLSLEPKIANKMVEKSLSHVETIPEGNTIYSTEKKNIETTPCKNNLAGNIKPRRLKIPKRIISTDQKKNDENGDDLDKNLNTQSKQLKPDVHKPSVQNKKTDKTISHLEVNSAGAFGTISEGNDDWEDFIEETRIVTKLYESPAKLIKNGQPENFEIFDDLRFIIEDKKKHLDSSRAITSPSKESAGYDRGYPIEQFRSNHNDKNFVLKPMHVSNNREEGWKEKNDGDLNKIENNHLDKFNRQQKISIDKYNREKRQYNKSTVDQRKVSRKYNNGQLSNYESYKEYDDGKLCNQRNGNSGQVKYDSDEDWDKDEVNNKNIESSTTDNVNVNAIVTLKTIETSTAPAITETNKTAAATTNNNNNENKKPTYDHNTSVSKSISTEQISEQIIEASVPQSPVDKEKLESEPSTLNNINTISGEMKPDELNNDNWDGAEVASPTLPTVCDEIASPSYLSVSSLSDYTPAMEIDGRMSFPAISYCLHELKIPKFEVNNPESLHKLLRSNSVDPRLLKYKEKCYMESSNSSPMLPYFSPQQISPYDPRRRSSSIFQSSTAAAAQSCYTQQDCYSPPQAQNPSVLLYKYLQCSPWYQSLMSTMKIQINHSIAELVRALNSYQKERLIDVTAIFDVFKIDCAGELLEIMRNIGIFIDSNGVIVEEKGYNQYGNRSTINNPAPINATYSFMPQLLPTTSHSNRGVVGFETNVSQQSACPVALPPQMQTTSFVSCYVDAPAMMPLTPRRQTPHNAANIMTPTPPPTEEDEDDFGSVRDNGYYRNGNCYRNCDMDGQRRGNDRAFGRSGECGGSGGGGSGNGRRRRNGGGGFYNHKQRY